MEAEKQVEGYGVIQAKYDMAAYLMMLIVELSRTGHFQEIHIGLIITYYQN